MENVRTSFNERDKATAKRARSVYMHEIKGLGFYWEFSYHPGQAAPYSERDYPPDRHIVTTDKLVGRIQAFGGFLADLESFEGRPATGPHAMSWDEEPTDVVTWSITAKERTTYHRLYDAIVEYTGALLRHGPASLEVAETMTVAAQIVTPELWRGAGYSIPEDIISPTQFNARHYLDAVIYVS